MSASTQGRRGGSGGRGVAGQDAGHMGGCLTQAPVRRPGAQAFHRLSGEVPVGAALQRAAVACCRGQEVGLVLANLNGDEWRARDFGTALPAMKEAGLPTEAPQWYPPASFGEVGAATGAVSTCMVVRAFVRGYAGSPHALVLLLADDETRSAYLLHAA
jgi:3-oxoacyl-[acyl-carrier-protein] synthase-1